MKVGFIGLGRMGQVMARRLIDGGHEVGVYNRTPEKAKPLTDAGAKPMASIKAAATIRRRGLHHAHRRRRGARGRRPVRRPEGIAAERRHPYLRRHAQRWRHPEAQGHSRRGRAGPDRFADARPPGSGRRRQCRHCRRRRAGGGHPLPRAVHGDRAARHRCRRRARRAPRPSRSPTISCSAAPSKPWAKAFRWCANTASRRRFFYSVLTDGLFNCWAYKTYGKFIADQQYLPAGQSALNGLEGRQPRARRRRGGRRAAAQRQCLARSSGRRRRARRRQARLGGDGEGSGPSQRAGVTRRTSSLRPLPLRERAARRLNQKNG